MKRLYFDIDGILLGHDGPKVALAPHAEKFVDFVLANFDCYWLTARCRGDAQPVLDYLRPHVSAALLRKLAQIKPTSFAALRTEVLDGDFLWLGGYPTSEELVELQRRGLAGQRVEKIDTRQRPGDLMCAMCELRMDLICAGSGERERAVGVGRPPPCLYSSGIGLPASGGHVGAGRRLSSSGERWRTPKPSAPISPVAV